MKERGVTCEELAAGAGVHVGSIFRWRQGRTLPGIESGRIVAQFLVDPALEGLIVRLRTRECVICHSRFVVLKNKDAVYCGQQRCKGVASDAKRNGVRREQAEGDRRKFSMALNLYRTAVSKHCWECEPEGTCRTPECNLREVSPLRLARMTA